MPEKLPPQGVLRKTANFYAWFRDFFGHTPKKRTPIPLADLAFPRSDPGALCRILRLSHFFAWSAKRPPTLDISDRRLPRHPFCTRSKIAPSCPPASKSPVQYRRRQRKEDRTHRASIGVPPPEPLPRALFCHGFCYCSPQHRTLYPPAPAVVRLTFCHRQKPR